MESSSENKAHSPNEGRTLVIMAKAPRPGAVKTRLASSLSPAAVADFYCCLLDDTLALARSLKLGGVEVAIMCPESDVDELARLAGMPLAGKPASVVAQKGEGLAAGLTSVFAHFAEGRRTNAHRTNAHQRRIIAFNSDSPHLPRSVLATVRLDRSRRSCCSVWGSASRMSSPPAVKRWTGAKPRFSTLRRSASR
jgi:hypothetical protein